MDFRAAGIDQDVARGIRRADFFLERAAELIDRIQIPEAVSGDT